MGSSYAERSSAGAPEVACTWTQAVDADSESHFQRVVPDGCIDLIWSSDSTDGPRLQLAGPDTTGFLAEIRPGTSLVGVRFRPGMAPPALGVAADAVRNVHAPLRELWGWEADALEQALTEASDPEAVLLACVSRRVRACGPADPSVDAVVAALRGPLGVRDVATHLGFSERQLRRRAVAAFGYPPKTLQRVLRFQYALSLARSRVPFAEVAATVGYADQTHLAHEVRDLAGIPLGTLIAT